MTARSEKIIQAGDKEIRLLFTNMALASAEAATGKSILIMARSFSNGEASITDAVSITRSAMEAARRDAKSVGQPVSLVDAYEVMDNFGFIELAKVIIGAMNEVLGYSSKNS
jgi:hypothetical protein